MAPAVLYSYWRSGCSWRVRTVLELLDVEYEIRPVHLVKGGGEQFSEEYAEKNPMKQVPALLIDDLTLTQSLAIIEYLIETRGEGKVELMGKDAASRAKIRQISEMIASGIQPIQNLSVLTKIAKDFGDEHKMPWAKHFITVGFEAVEKVLSKSAGKYCVGDELSLADVCIPPQVYNANRFGVDMSQFPIISRIDAQLAEIDAFKKAHPDSQPDKPEGQ